MSIWIIAKTQMMNELRGIATKNQIMNRKELQKDVYSVYILIKFMYILKHMNQSIHSLWINMKWEFTLQSMVMFASVERGREIILGRDTDGTSNLLSVLFFEHLNNYDKSQYLFIMSRRCIVIC